MDNNLNNKNSGFRLIKNTVLNLFNTLFALANGWIISIWLARQIGPEKYGIFTQVQWLVGTFSWIIGMGFIISLTKFIAELKNKNDTDTMQAIVRTILKIELTLAFITTIILGFLRTQIADLFFTPNESIFFFIAILGIIPGITTAIFSATIEGLQKFEYFTFSSLILTPMSFFAKVLVLWFGQGIEGILIVMLVFSVLNTIFYSFVLKKEGIKFWRQHKKLDKKLKKRIFKYNISVIPIMLCDKIIWDKSEFFFLGLWCQATESAFYGMAYNTVQRLTSILPTTLWRVLFPTMSQYFGDGNKEKMRRVYFLSTRYLAFVAFPVSVAGVILAYQIIKYLPGHPYISAQRPLQVLFMASMITSTSNPGAAILYGYEKQSFIFKLGAIMSVVNILLDIFLIKKYGALGASVCFAITTVIGSTIGTIYTCKTMKLRFPVISLSKIFFATVIMGIVMELIILKFSEIPGFIISIIVGIIVYLASALALGTFEQEDYQLLNSIKKVMPGTSKSLIDSLINFINQIKPDNSNSNIDNNIFK